ncbi:MAG: hypothetical protein AB7I18_11540 [Candidatus Berkiella sp.]
MKTVAFAGQYDVQTQILGKYIGSKSNYLDSMSHTMDAGEQVKILKAKNPYGLEVNKYQWASDAQIIFVCVNADNPDFFKHFTDEVNNGRFATDQKIMLVAHVAKITEQSQASCQEIAADNQAEVILCSIHSSDALFFSPNHASKLPFAAVFDHVIQNTIQASIEPEKRRKMQM